MNVIGGVEMKLQDCGFSVCCGGVGCEEFLSCQVEIWVSVVCCRRLLVV